MSRPTLAVSRAQEPKRGTSEGCWVRLQCRVRCVTWDRPPFDLPAPTGLGKGARGCDPDPGSLQKTSPLHLMRSQRTVTRRREPKRGFKHPGEMRLVGKTRL